MSEQSVPKKTVKKSSKKSVKKSAKKVVRKKSAPKPVVSSSRVSALLLLLVMLLLIAVVILGIKLIQKESSVDKVTAAKQIKKSSTDSPNQTKTTLKKESIKDTSANRERDSDIDKKNDGQEMAPTVKGKLVFLYYNENTDDLMYKSVVRSFRTGQEHTDVLMALLKGPLPSEEILGYESSLSSAIIINSFSIKNGIATIDVSQHFAQNAFGDIGVARVNQLLMTLKQFPEIKGITISIKGKKIDTMGDGRHFSWPLYNKL